MKGLMFPATAEPLTPVSFLRRSATVFPERLAIVDGETRLSYRDMYDRVRRQAGMLRALSVKPGDRVAVLAPNARMLLEAHYGVPMAGAVLVALNTRLTVAELAYIVEHSGASVLLYDESLGDVAANLDVQEKVSHLEYEQRLAEADLYETAVTDELELLSLNYTSGTTGRPKGVMYHHRGAYLQALAMAYHARLETTTVYLWTLPMFHCNGWSFTWAVTAGGGTHVCLPKVDPARIWQLIDDEGVNSLNAAPTVLIDLTAHPSAHPLEHRVAVGTGGAPPAPALLAQLRTLGFEVTHLYGLTETFGPSVISEFPPELEGCSVEEEARFKARQGNANIIGTPVRVVGENGHDVPSDAQTVGEVVVHGNNVALGYYRDSAATEESFGSGWFRTGDLGVMHPDQYVELRDRAKDIIISGGENIASIEVEQVLASHPAVLEVAVVAAPHERWGEVPHAFVTLAEGAEATEEGLIAFVRERLPGFKTPKRVTFGVLPKTATGKIQKYLLRDTSE